MTEHFIQNVRAFPSGIRNLFDKARGHIAADGKPMRIIMWTEPERVSPGTYIHDNHPEYVYQPDDVSESPTLARYYSRHAQRRIVMLPSTKYPDCKVVLESIFIEKCHERCG